MTENATRTVSERVVSTWRDLGRLPAYRVPMFLGGALAVLLGLATYGTRALQAGSALALPLGAVYLLAFGALGLAGHALCRQNPANGAIVAAVAGLGLLLLVGDMSGFLTGLLLILPAVWGLAKAL